jgi:hypothetical protein
MKWSARAAVSIASVVVLLPLQGAVQAQSPGRADDVAAYWTAERRAAAQPRDLVIDQRGLGYLRRADGSLDPHGHSQSAVITAVPGRSVPQTPSGDATVLSAPVITIVTPARDDVIGVSHTFKARVQDSDGLRSVTFVIHYPDGRTQKFSPTHAGDDVYEVLLQGFTNGSWKWHVEAKDRGPRGGQSAKSDVVPFTVSTSTSGGGSGGGDTGSDVVAKAGWAGGEVQTAIGRIFFEMPTNKRLNRWAGYVCSGTAVQENRADASLIVTAAHCIYDDVNKAFARNVLFIPDQANGGRTDANCSNDPIGCWKPTNGVVDTNWTTRSWPDNAPWDYGFYVVPVSGAYTAGKTEVNESLERAVPPQALALGGISGKPYTHALGYPYSDDPALMYCAETVGEVSMKEGSYVWLDSCAMTGGSSGGPWMPNFDTAKGSGAIASINSWGYSTRDGMAGPKFAGSSASCVFGAAESSAIAPTDRGVIVTCS